MARVPRLSHVRTLCPLPSPIVNFCSRYSFAYATMGHRLPTILGKAIDDVIETLNQESEEDRVTDLIQCIERMDQLKIDLEQHAKLRPVVDDGEADVALWNKEIAKYFQGGLASFILLGSLSAEYGRTTSTSNHDHGINDYTHALCITGKDFMNAPWLFAEAYKYRRLRECFAVSKFWQQYDVFFRQKVSCSLSLWRQSFINDCTVRHVLSIKRRCL